MKNINISSGTFSIPDSSYTFLNNYLDRIRKFLEKNNLDNDLFSDIEERISEKFHTIIDSGLEITEKNVIDIVNEIGEPEDIFGDLKKEIPSLIDFKLQKRLHRNSNKGVVFGVCAGLGEYFDIDPVWIRIAFFVFCLFYGIGILVYILLAIFLPNINDEALDYEKNIADMKNKMVELSNKSFIERFFIKFIKIINNIFNLFFRLASFGFFALGGLFMFFGGMAILILGGFVNSGIVFDNQDIFFYLPIQSQYAIIFSGIIIFLFGVTSLLFSIKVKILNKYIFIFLVTCLSLCFVFITNGVFSIISKYNNNYDFMKIATIQGSQSGKTLELVLQQKNPNIHGFFDGNPRIKFEVSKDEKVSFEVKTSIRSNNTDNAAKIFTELEDFIFRISDNIIYIDQPKNSFKKVVPFAFLQREIVIKVPYNVKFDTKNITRSFYYNAKIKPSKEMEQNGIYDCIGEVIQVNKEKNALFCNN